MKAFNCFFIICGVIVSSDLVFGVAIEIRKVVPEKNGVVAAAPSEGAITDDLLKKAGESIAKIQESLIREINNQANEESLIQNLQNKTTKQLKKPDIRSKDNKVQLDVSNNLDRPESISKINSAQPIDSEGSHSQGEALVTSYWQPATRDLSKDTLINDRISQQQASAGIVKIDPDAEFIDPKNHKGHIAQDTRTTFKYNSRPSSSNADRDVEEVGSDNSLETDQAPAADLTGDILVNEHMAERLASGSIKADPDTEFIDPKQHEGHMVRERTRLNVKHSEPSGILSRFGPNRDRDVEESGTDGTNSFDQKPVSLEQDSNTDQSSIGIDLSRDILVNEHAAKQRAAGLVNTDPDVEIISLDRPSSSSKNYNNYYYVPDTIQQVPVSDLTRDASVSVETFDEQQPPYGEMIEPYSEYTNQIRNRRPIQNSYLRNADRFQRTPQHDLSQDTAINDHISQQQSASGLVMIDPDAELINTDANHQNNVYYYYSYVPNNIDQAPRLKRTEPVYQFYQRPVIRYQYPQQPIIYY
ncbi:uncharacterized protein LOC135835444 [Planococcus citri]|uniref:uncharacterized protein LOC135835444 n=1 Tax=Planococcus citri TaxID=170843 RepID=UPI0031FA31CD